MKKLKLMVLPAALGIYLTSCTIAHTAVVTNNPVGTKVGVAKAGPFMKDSDVSYFKAMENGKIKTIGIAEFKATVFIFPFYKTTITGE
jgi:hypothetical protein